MRSPFFMSKALTIVAVPSVTVAKNNDFVRHEISKVVNNAVILAVAEWNGFIICFWLVIWINLQNFLGSGNL